MQGWIGSLNLSYPRIMNSLILQVVYSRSRFNVLMNHHLRSQVGVLRIDLSVTRQMLMLRRELQLNHITWIQVLTELRCPGYTRKVARWCYRLGTMLSMDHHQHHNKESPLLLPQYHSVTLGH
jgi:hypothetical protein